MSRGDSRAWLCKGFRGHGLKIPGLPSCREEACHRVWRERPLWGQKHTPIALAYGARRSLEGFPSLPSGEGSGAAVGGEGEYFAPNTLWLFFDVLVHEGISHLKKKKRLILLFKGKINFVIQRKAFRLKALDSGPEGAGTALGPKWNNG